MNKALSTVLKSWLVCTALAASALALALPTPKDIETAVSQGQLTQAESMLREVIAAKPQSAKAHYELGQVLMRANRPSDAHAELQRAQAIDPSLKFASSDQQFKDLLERTQAPRSAPPTATVQAEPAAPAPSGNGFSMTIVWIGLAAMAAIAYLMRMNRPAPRPMAPAYSPAPAHAPDYAPAAAPMGASPPAGTPLSTAFGRNPAPTYGAAGGPPATGYPSAAPAPGSAGGGSTLTGAVVGGLAGVAAGYALSKALEGSHTSAPPAAPAPAPEPAHKSWADEQGHVSAEPDFDPGTGSDWDDGGGDAGDDSW